MGELEDSLPFSSGCDVFSRLIERLRIRGVTFKHTVHEPVFTSAEAAAVRGVSLKTGAKALIVRTDDRAVMFVLPADRSLNSGAARRCVGARGLKFVPAEELAALTGLTPGSIPPFGSLFGLPTYGDVRLADNESINFNAGTHTDSLQIRYEDYVAVEEPVICSVSK